MKKVERSAGARSPHVLHHRRHLGESGCATFIRTDIPYRLLGVGGNLECIVVEIWEREEPTVIINFYNPCLRLELQSLLGIQGQDRRRVIWCGDFNAQNNLLGGQHTDANGSVVLEDLMEERDLVLKRVWFEPKCSTLESRNSLFELYSHHNRLGTEQNELTENVFVLRAEALTQSLRCRRGR